MQYPYIRRGLLAILIIVQAWNIAGTGICRQNNDTRYCLYVADVTWADALTACTERGARLAWDNSSTYNVVLYELIRNSKVSQVWIGGKTGPLYWNWMNKDLHTEGIYYQGCYNSEHIHTSKCDYKWSKKECKTYCKGFIYFSYHMESSSRKCCCFNIHRMVEDGSYGRCSICENDNMPCGNDLTHRAIYMTNAQFPVKHIWQKYHPDGLTGIHEDALGLTVVLDNTGSETRMEGRHCTETHYPLCILDKREGWLSGLKCRSEEFSMNSAGKCLDYIREEVTWEAAVEKCKSLSLERNSVLSSFASYDHFRDLERVMRKIVDASERQVFWTFGSSRRWVWEDKDTFKRQDIEYARWNKDDAKFPERGHCILLNENAKWSSTPCKDESAGFICESVEKTTITKTSVLTTTFKTETTKSPIDSTKIEHNTGSVPHCTSDMISYTQFESSTFSFTTEDSGPDSEPQSADHTIPVVAAVGSVVGLIILTAAVVLLVWRKRRRMTNKGSGSGKVNVGFSSTTGVDLHNRSENEYNEVDHGDYTTIAETGNRSAVTENIDCTGEHVYESAQCSDLPNVVKDHILNTSPNGIAIKGPDRRVLGSTENTYVNPNLNPVTEASGDVSVLYSVPKKGRKNRSEIKTQPESNLVMIKRAEEQNERRQPNSGQISDQSTECEGAVVYAVPNKPTKRSEVTADANTPDSVYAYAAETFPGESVDKNTDNADYYNFIASQNQQRNMGGSPSDVVEVDEYATTLVDNDIYNT